MKSRTMAIAASVAALSFAATPVAALAATSHHGSTTQSRVDRSRDASGARHVDKSPDQSRADTSLDKRDF
jgi:hypothetical protein